MKKILLVLFTVLFSTSLLAHSPPNKGVTIGGDNMDVYMPQFINFFKENLL